MFKLRTTEESSLTPQVWIMMNTYRVLILNHVLTGLPVSLTRLLATKSRGYVLFIHSFTKGLWGICSMLYTVQGTKDTKQTWSLSS